MTNAITAASPRLKSLSLLKMSKRMEKIIMIIIAIKMFCVTVSANIMKSKGFGF
jgi:hypothetical protein